MNRVVRAFGGGPLLGSKYVRIAYLDEAGVSPSRDEPIAVVAGVIVHGDIQILPLERALGEIVSAFPAERLEQRYIHTAWLYQGTGPFHKSKGWNEAMRFAVLDRVAQLFAELHLPIVYGICEKSSVPPSVLGIHRSLHQAAHVTASANCTVKIERFMRELEDSEELAWIVMENHSENRLALKKVHQYFASYPQNNSGNYDSRWVPLTRIRGTPQFEDKTDVSLLQIADFCAFVIKRKMMRDPYIDRFYAPMRGWLTHYYADPDHPLS